MAPRKSNPSAESQAAADSPSPTQPATATEQQLKAQAEVGVNVEDYLLPRSLMLRIAKSVLPSNTSIQKDAVLAIQKAATVFVSYVSSHANEATLKRTVVPADVFAALSELEFDAFRPRLEKELETYMEIKAARKQKKSPQAGVSKAGPGAAADRDEAEGDSSSARGAKRVKRDDEGVGMGGSGVFLPGRNGTAGVGHEGDDEENQEEDDEEDEEGDGDVDDDETIGQDVDYEVDEDETEEEDDEYGDDGNDIDRVEDLDLDTRPKRSMNPDTADDDSDDDDAGPSAQLRGGLEMG